MYYQFYEWNHAFLSPARALNDAVRLYYRNPLNPLTHTEFGRQIAAAGDLFERMTRHYGKPDFGIEETVVDGQTVAVSEKVVWERPFCRLVKFERDLPANAPRQPNLILVAPMSGHYATLLRGTVQALLPHNNVYITDWVDARKVPLTVGRFDLDDFIDYIIDIIHHFDGDAHLVAVCQPAVPVFAATAIMERRQSAILPKSITLMGGPIDTRKNPTEVNTYAEKHDLDWFRRNVIMVVPFPHPGVMRKVYPGFLQLSGFMTMNLDRHLTAHYDYFDNLVKGDGDSADKHRDFYDEYLSVMDLTAEFYLQTVETVFLRHALPKGEMTHRSEAVDPAAITRTPILTIEGEKDDISGIGQTRAAHSLAVNLPDEKHRHYEQSNVGHYGVFNGSRFRNEIAPRICEFIRQWDDRDPGLSSVAETAAQAIAAFDAAARDLAIAADTLKGLAVETAPAPSAETDAADDTAAAPVPLPATEDLAPAAAADRTDQVEEFAEPTLSDTAGSSASETDASRTDLAAETSAPVEPASPDEGEAQGAPQPEFAGSGSEAVSEGGGGEDALATPEAAAEPAEVSPPESGGDDDMMQASIAAEGACDPDETPAALQQPEAQASAMQEGGGPTSRSAKRASASATTKAASAARARRRSAATGTTGADEREAKPTPVVAKAKPKDGPEPSPATLTPSTAGAYAGTSRKRPRGPMGRRTPNQRDNPVQADKD